MVWQLCASGRLTVCILTCVVEGEGLAEHEP